MKSIFLITIMLGLFSLAQAQDHHASSDKSADQTTRTTGYDGHSSYDWSWKTNQGGVGFTPPPPDPIPIDGGLGFLLVAGMGFGLRSIKKRRKK